jgi:hypothetical protein
MWLEILDWKHAIWKNHDAQILKTNVERLNWKSILITQKDPKLKKWQLKKWRSKLKHKINFIFDWKVK